MPSGGGRRSERARNRSKNVVKLADANKILPALGKTGPSLHFHNGNRSAIKAAKINAGIPRDLSRQYLLDRARVCRYLRWFAT
jgi:hypothetical protein